MRSPSGSATSERRSASSSPRVKMPMIDAPRAFAGLFSGRNGLALETGYDGAVKSELEGRGHATRWSDEALGGAQAIILGTDGVLIGASDPRKDGCALGF